MAIKDILDNWIDSRLPGMSTEDFTFDTYKKMKSDLGNGGLPSFELPTFTVPSLQSALFRDVDYNPVQLNINPNDMVITSHELGHLTDFKKNKGNVKLYKILDKLPVLHNASTLLKEYNANKNSWDLIQKAYKDDPALLKHFGDMRSKLLPKAYSTYLVANGIPLATSVGGGALGAWLGSKLGGSEEDELLDDLLPEDRRKHRKRRRKITKALGALAGGSVGVMAGDTLGGGISNRVLPKVYENLQKFIASSGYRGGLKDLNAMIRNFKPKGK